MAPISPAIFGLYYNGTKMKLRLIIAIISTIMEEALIAFIFLWALPQLEIEIPIGVLVAVLVLWTLGTVLTYRVGSKALDRNPLQGLDSMIGSRGVVIRPLAPEGLVRIGSEVWIAESCGRRVEVGEEVTVVAERGLRLIVTPRG